MSEKSKNGCQFKSPMIIGKRLFGITQCSRGIGDFTLVAYDNVAVKPFLSSTPCIARLCDDQGEVDSSSHQQQQQQQQTRTKVVAGRFEFLIVATDGLWDAITHDDAVNIVRRVVARKFLHVDVLARAAEALVRHVRRKSIEDTNRWDGSLDDISVFVIPMSSFASLSTNRRRRRCFSSQQQQQQGRKSIRSLTTTTPSAQAQKKNKRRGFKSTPSNRDRVHSEEYGLRWETRVSE